MEGGPQDRGDLSTHSSPADTKRRRGRECLGLRGAEAGMEQGGMLGHLVGISTRIPTSQLSAGRTREQGHPSSTEYPGAYILVSSIFSITWTGAPWKQG